MHFVLDNTELTVFIRIAQRVVVRTLGRIIRDGDFGAGSGVRAGVEEYGFLGVSGDYSDTVGVGECEVGIEEKEDARHGTGERECGMEFRPGEGVCVED